MCVCECMHVWMSGLGVREEDGVVCVCVCVCVVEFQLQGEREQMQAPARVCVCKCVYVCLPGHCSKSECYYHKNISLYTRIHSHSLSHLLDDILMHSRITCT